MLRWSLTASPSVPAEIKARLQKSEGGRITNTGDVLITSQRFRDQERNRQDCLEKLAGFLRGLYRTTTSEAHAAHAGIGRSAFAR